MARLYTVSDGTLVLSLTVAPEGGFVVTSPLHPELVTEGEDIAECFANARDAIKSLAQARAKLARQLQALQPRHAA